MFCFSLILKLKHIFFEFFKHEKNLYPAANNNFRWLTTIVVSSYYYFKCIPEILLSLFPFFSLFAIGLMTQFPSKHLALAAAVDLVTVSTSFQLVPFSTNTVATATDRFYATCTAVLDHNLEHMNKH